MQFFYGTLGAIASAAMIINVVMIIALHVHAGRDAHLPGIAGIVLTIGQAVDSNVLFLRTLREEVKAGRPITQAMETGFNKAFGSIIDANLPDDADRRHHPVLHGLRPRARLRRDAVDRHHHHRVHGLHRVAPDDLHLAAPQPVRRRCPGRPHRLLRLCADPLHAGPQIHLRRLALLRDRLGRGLRHQGLGLGIDFTGGS